MKKPDYSILHKTVFPILRALIKTGYFSFDLRGIENVPKSGKVVYVANHSGWFTLDGLLCGLAISDNLGDHRLPITLTEDLLLKTPVLGHFFRTLGGIPASHFHKLDKLVSKIEVLGIFPEGTEGNCKPFWSAYKMKEWSSSFVHAAVKLNALIVPVAIVGAEECLPNLPSPQIIKKLLGTQIPIPISLFPFPTRWEISFLKPVDLRKHKIKNDYSSYRKIARQIQNSVQRELDVRAQNHPIPKIRNLINSLTSLINKK